VLFVISATGNTYDGSGVAGDGAGSGLDQVGEVLFLVHRSGAGDAADRDAGRPREEVVVDLGGGGEGREGHKGQKDEGNLL
jgi:hypothetical protein